MRVFASLMSLLLISASLSATPQEDLNRLIEGNNRFINGELEHPNRDEEYRLRLVESQYPFAVIVGCSDSRVSPEIIFDQGIGDLFIVRLAGNVIDAAALDSVEYAALYLNSRVALVLGHQNCGAVDAVISGTTKDIESVAELIEPAVREVRKKSSKDLLIRATKANALNMRDFLMTRPALSKLIKEGKFQVYAGYYNFDTGKVEILQTEE